MRRKKSVLGFLGVVLFACCFGLIVVTLAKSKQGAQVNLYPTAVIEIIPAPTLTPTTLPTASPFPDEDVFQPLPGNPFETQIEVGDAVQIYGTQGDGLRLRASPGLDGNILFLAFEGEIFRVEDGPREVSGYVWWYLVAPYDENVKGWAVENFIKRIDAQN
ncbi:MAG: hypothetical protein Kow0088_11410 [Anaerolineales bacterium]